ncbi:hypothetical protein ACSW9O_16055 (plasmid) [Clostridium perfringens]|nr:hypothetical protein [Clostridium perfringens]
MLKDYFGESEYIEGIGEIYPVNVKEYEGFSTLAQLYIAVDKRALEIEIGENLDGISTLEIVLNKIKAFEISDNQALLNLLNDEERATYEKLKESKYKMNIEDFKKIIKMVLHKEVTFDEEEIRFVIEDDNILESKEININNFDRFKDIVMRQNLLFTPLYYEDPVLQSILENLRENKPISTNENKLDLEAICQLLSLKMGINPENFDKYTYYQVIANFTRLQFLENYDWVKHIQTSGFGSKDLVTPKINETIDLNMHPESKMIDFNSEVYDKGDKL